jgi:putative endonuclease
VIQLVDLKTYIDNKINEWYNACILVFVALIVAESIVREDRREREDMEGAHAVDTLKTPGGSLGVGGVRSASGAGAGAGKGGAAARKVAPAAPAAVAAAAAKREPKPFIERAGRRMSVGRQGEALAVSYLEVSGYEILRRNFTCRLGEIDVVARPRGENTLCLIEVKCRRNDKMGRPYESVGVRKKKHYRQVATVFLMREWDGLRVDATTEFRFDVIEVILSAGKPQINHIRNAFV